MAKLAAYVAKRNFDRTAEPKGGTAHGSGSSFVIQKHAATRLHYDLRLELDGVMLSWAVTKGPSLIPGEKRLAVHVEDHPIEYNTFEGTIPKGQYGGGTVLIWDRGSWEPEQDPRRGMAKGHLDFRLDGEKIHGRFHLVRLKPRPGEKQEPWLLIKSEDEFARQTGDPDIVEELPRSVATGRTLDEIASDQDSAVWHSNRGREDEQEPVKGAPRGKSAPPPPPRAKSARAKKAEPTPAAWAEPAARKGKDVMPSAIEPCLATLVDKAPNGPGWVHEIKWDGYRLLVLKTRRDVRVLTRRGLDWTPRFPGIAAAASALPVETAILDGEAVIEDESGKASFSALQNALSDEHGKVARDAALYAFDLLYLDGQDLRGLPLDTRKERLAELVPAGSTGPLRLSEHIEGDGDAMLRNACRLGLEGVISKRRDRPYRSGRGKDWVKTKCTDRQEFVICGYVPSTAAPNAIGSLIMGYYEGGDLRHAGRCGTGYTGETARAIWKKLDPLTRKTSPFARKLSAEERRGAVFVEPRLVAEVEFRGWTGDDLLRHASFKGLREDKNPAEIVRERPAAEPAPEPAPPPPLPKRAGRHIKGASVAGVPLTHPERVLWDEGITKLDLARFYEEIADWLMPHIAGRPLSLVRCPDGAAKGCFFQKHSWVGLGEDIRRATVRDEDGEEEVLYVETIAGVIALVQASVLEIHVWGATMVDVEHPDRIVMDLDPAEDVAWPDVIAAAKDVRERLSSVGLESFTKTTGGKGLHVVVPLVPRAGWVEVKTFCQALATEMERDDPRRYISKASKAARRGLIYVDYLRNGRGATAIAPYSTRNCPGATIAVPVDWKELTPRLKPNGFTVANLPARLKRLKADPWAEMGRIEQVLPTLPGPGTKGSKRRA